MISIVKRVAKRVFVPVDQWVPREEDMIFKERKNIITAPIHSFYNMSPNSDINIFFMTPKKCYNGVTKVKQDGSVSVCFREHCVKYLNYFENFYDTDHSLLWIYARVKYMMEAHSSQYNAHVFIDDLIRYIISPLANPILHYAINRMNNDNYIPMTSLYKNTKNPCLEYKDIHAKCLMEASLVQILIIPLVSHYMWLNKIPSIDIKDFLMACFDPVYLMIKEKYGIDLQNKMYETIITNVGKNRTQNSILWDMQAVRGTNPTIHSYETMQNLIIQIVPKYKYCENIVSFNSNVIKHEIMYKVVGIPYEYDLIPVSSSKRDDDNNSETDRFEAHMIEQNEALLMQLRVNCREVMKKIERLYGPFSEDEINFYMQQLSKDGRHIKNTYQSQLINYIFMKEFGDVNSIKLINVRQYIILMIAAKKQLHLNGLHLLAEIIGGRVEKLVSRKTVNKSILQAMQLSESYNYVLDKYKNEDILQDTLFGFIAKTIASEFSYIDYYNKYVNGQKIDVNKSLIGEEFLKYCLLI